MWTLCYYMFLFFAIMDCMFGVKIEVRACVNVRQLGGIFITTERRLFNKTETAISP